MRLTFKGETRKRTRRRRPERDEPTERDEQTHDSDGRWVDAPAARLVVGPAILAVRAVPRPTALASDSLGKVFPMAAGPDETDSADGDKSLEPLDVHSQPLDADSQPLDVHSQPLDADSQPLDADSQPLDAHSLEPLDVRQVWVIVRIAGSEDRVALRSAHGKYLSADDVGNVSALREAVGPQEGFRLLAQPDIPACFALETVHGRYLRLDPDRGHVRADAESVGPCESFLVRIQAGFLPRGGGDGQQPRSSLHGPGDDDGRQHISRRELEHAAGFKLDDEQAKMLKRAHRQGNFHETLLDIRIKNRRHDKFG